MSSDLKEFIQQTPLCDSHEHLKKEQEWMEDGPRDVLEDLFTNYQPADLSSAGASDEQVARLRDGSDPDQQGRFDAVRSSWEAVRFTGYGEAVRILAQELYGLREWNAAEFSAAQEKLDGWRQPGGRYHLLKEVANIDHVQTDDFCWPCLPDASGAGFFFYDISWAAFCDGRIDIEMLHSETGVEVTNLAQLRQAMECIFDRHAEYAIAVKAQHAYSRTLYWQERDDSCAASALEAVLGNEEPSEGTRLTLGDWCWARGVELAIEHDLPFKLHTGYYAGNDRMPVDRIKGGNLCALLAKYTDCRFVLMHIAYPYSDELIALTKHYRNVYADLCWAWSIDPYSSSDFVRRFIHSAPANKLFAFGGDTSWPTSAVAYSIQSRRWLHYALEAEVADGLLSETEAMDVAGRLMRDNQHACFNVQKKRDTCIAAMAEGEPSR
jgi:hypothetical protein